jgi:hypothetical protein
MSNNECKVKYRKTDETGNQKKWHRSLLSWWLSHILRLKAEWMKKMATYTSEEFKYYDKSG